MLFRLVVITSTALLATPLVSAKQSTSAPTRPSEPGGSVVPFTAAEFSKALLAETNRLRREHRLSQLSGMSELDAAADDQAWYMALQFRVQHSSELRNRATPMDRVRRYGIEAQSCFENAASVPIQEGEKTLTGPEIAAKLVAAWMASPGHRANLLNGDVTHFGGAVRVVYTPAKVWYAYGIQIFVRIGPSRFEAI